MARRILIANWKMNLPPEGIDAYMATIAACNPRETTTIVTTDGEGRGGGTVVAVVLLIAVLALLFYLFGGNLMNGGADKTDVKVDIEAPAGGGSGS